MGLANRLRAALKDRAPAPVTMPTKEPTPAQLIGARQGFTLTADDFDGGKQVPGVKSILASYRVPKDTALIIPRGVPFRLYIQAMHQEVFAADGATTKTVTLPFNLAKSVRGEDEDVKVFVSTNEGATFLEGNLISVNYETNEVTFGKNSSTNHYQIFALTTEGEVEISAQKPGGSTSVSSRQWNASLRRIHQTDQDQGETALMLMGSEPEIQLAPEWRLNLVLNSPATFWHYGLEFFIEAYTQRLRVQNAEALNALTEASLR